MYSKLKSEEEDPLTLEAIDEIIRQAQEDKVDPRLIRLAEKKRKNIYISSKTELLKEYLEQFKVEELKELYEKVTEERFILDDELKEGVEDLLAKVEENPNYV